MKIRELSFPPILFIILCSLCLSNSSFANNSEEFRSDNESALPASFDIEWLQEMRFFVAVKPDSVAGLLEANLDQIYQSENQDAIEQANYLLGLAYYFKGEYLISNYYYDRVLSMQGIGNIRILEAVNNNKGVNLELMGQFESAIEVYLESQRIAEMRQDTLGIGQSKLNLGVLFHQLRDTVTASQYVAEALQLFERVDDEYHIALANMNYGTYIYHQRPDEGAARLEAALETFKKIDDPYRIAETLYHQATVFIGSEEHETAFQKALESLQYQPAELYNNLKVNTFILIIRSQEKSDRAEQAIPWIDELNRAVE